MALLHSNPATHFTPPDNRALQNQPTSSADSLGDELTGETDEPPDDQQSQQEQTPRAVQTKTTEIVMPVNEFRRSVVSPRPNRNSLLSKILHSESSSQEEEDEDSPFYRGDRARSSTSTHSRGSFASTAELTSDGGHTSPARTGTPSPPLPVTLLSPLPATSFNQKSFEIPATARIHQQDPISPLQNSNSDRPANELNVEAGLGRRRCITFVCGGGKDVKAPTVEVVKAPKEELKTSDPPKRASMLKFICPCPAKPEVPKEKARTRAGSPHPSNRATLPPISKSPRTHRGSDSTLRNSSPKTVRKLSLPPRINRDDEDSDDSRPEAMRFHEFAHSEPELDDWTQESTCHRQRLTVDDTLSIELSLRKLGKEVEEEEEEEEEEDDDEEAEDADVAIDDDEDDDEDDNEEDEGDDDEEVYSRRSSLSGYPSDEGFQTDNEEGFAVSDDSDHGSEFDFWTPGLAASGDQIEHIRPKGSRTQSFSSNGSFDSVRPYPGISSLNKPRRKKSRPLDVKTAPELPDSTDFVCGTLDEDKPLEQAYLSHLELRRAAKHKIIPQDIDPTFPASDPEMDEEDEDSEHDEPIDSDHQLFHGQMDFTDDGERKGRGLVPRKRSPLHSPKRLRSPPPNKRISVHRSPPPPNFHHRRTRSPAPPCHTARGTFSASVPRNQALNIHLNPQEQDVDLDLDDESTPRFLPTRRAIDIVKGLEKKRQRRREKLYERHHRRMAKTKEKKPQPGKGCERMREMGLGLNAYRGKKAATTIPQQETEMHMLSY